MLYIRANIGELWLSVSPLGAKIPTGVKCYALVLYPVAEHDEIWHDEVHLCVEDLFLFWWTFTTKFGSTRGIANGHWFPKFRKLCRRFRGQIFFKNIEECIFLNTFLVHHLVERDEVYHGEGHLCPAGHLFWWTLVHLCGSRNFEQWISPIVLVTAQQNFAVLGVLPMDICSQNLVNFGRLFRRQNFFLKILNSVKFFLTLFLYIVWLSAMKFGVVSSICAQQVSSYFGELWSIFGEQKFLTVNISYTSCCGATKYDRVRDLANWYLFSEFPELWSGVPRYHVATCISPSMMHLFTVKTALFSGFHDARDACFDKLGFKLVMVALHSRCGHYIFALWCLNLLSFYLFFLV